MVAVFPGDDGDDGVDVMAQFYLPGDGLEDRGERDRVPYTVLARSVVPHGDARRGDRPPVHRSDGGAAMQPVSGPGSGL